MNQTAILHKRHVNKLNSTYRRAVHHNRLPDLTKLPLWLTLHHSQRHLPLLNWWAVVVCLLESPVSRKISITIKIWGLNQNKSHSKLFHSDKSFTCHFYSSPIARTNATLSFKFCFIKLMLFWFRIVLDSSFVITCHTCLSRVVSMYCANLCDSFGCPSNLARPDAILKWLASRKFMVKVTCKSEPLIM